MAPLGTLHHISCNVAYLKLSWLNVVAMCVKKSMLLLLFNNNMLFFTHIIKFTFTFGAAAETGRDTLDSLQYQEGHAVSQFLNH